MRSVGSFLKEAPHMKYRRKTVATPFLFVSLAVRAGFQNCSQPYNIQKAPIASSSVTTAAPPAVCSPLGGSATASINNGLIAELYYLPEGKTTNTVSTFFTSAGVKENAQLFLNNISVPKTYFSSGFQLNDGSFLKDDAGNLLNEYFALDLTSSLVLGASDLPGDYQVAFISDDGVIMQADLGGGMQTIVNNDGQHSATMGCATKYFQMSSGSSIPIHISYFQGPRNYIAFTMLWRPVTSSTAAESYCGTGDDAGNSFYTEPNASSPIGVPTERFNQLLRDGFKVLLNTNFVLPHTVTNPCVN